jgi:murein DD-endopeptidase MepM/ murein hydrolase activator NlpD
MGQRLKLPIDDLKPTAGYKNKKYADEFPFMHFGVDMISVSGKRDLYALGDGEVVAAGNDKGCGNVIVVIYNKCINNKTKETKDLVVTYMHLYELPLVKAGQKVNKKTLLGYYGATGDFVTGPHLHVQMDTDTKYPLYCTGLGIKGHNVLKKGTVDSTVNPCEWFWKEKGQTIKAPASEWYKAADFAIPNMPVKPKLYPAPKQGEERFVTKD